MAARPNWFFVWPSRNRNLIRNRSCLRSKKGFTLVELLVALTLMAIGVFAVVGMQLVAMNSNFISNQLSVANSLAQEVLEDVMSWTPNQPNINANNPTGINYQFQYLDPTTGTLVNTTTLAITGAGTYSATYTTLVGDNTNGVPTGVTRVVVKVTYTYKNSTKSMSITGAKRTV